MIRFQTWCDPSPTLLTAVKTTTSLRTHTQKKRTHRADRPLLLLPQLIHTSSLCQTFYTPPPPSPHQGAVARRRHVPKKLSLGLLRQIGDTYNLLNGLDSQLSEVPSRCKNWARISQRESESQENTIDCHLVSCQTLQNIHPSDMQRAASENVTARESCQKLGKETEQRSAEPGELGIQ